MHWTVAARLSWHSTGVHSAWISYCWIWYARWPSQTWFYTLLNSWVNLARALLHSPWFLRTLQELWLEIWLTTFSNAGTRCQICVTTSILIYLDGISEVVLLIYYYLVVKMGSSSVCWLWCRRPNKLLTRKLIRLVNWLLNDIWGSARRQILWSNQRLLLVGAIYDIVTIPPTIHCARLLDHHFTCGPRIRIQSRPSLIFWVGRVGTVCNISVAILLFINFMQILYVIKYLGYKLLVLSSVLLFVSRLINVFSLI